KAWPSPGPDPFLPDPDGPVKILPSGFQAPQPVPFSKTPRLGGPHHYSDGFKSTPDWANPEERGGLVPPGL
ncbi:MAG: hypothetical protein MI702_08035, partial [Chlorobiales bacterium]|nr:hypothetical protein [Chlorobiales bacterium]